MGKYNFKILLVILLSLLFILIGLFISTRFNHQLPTTNYQLIISPTSPPAPINLIRAKVAKVIDGDTIELTDKTRVRYIGINTPELAGKTQPSQCFATQSAYINRQLVEGQEVGLVKDLSETDKYGRLLRYVYIDDVFINDFMLRQGYARLETIPPDVKYEDLFLSAEKEARENKRGLWKECR